MQLFYAPDLTTPLYTLGEEESKHCIRVLRLRRGDTLHLTDGRGTLYRCEIAEEDARRCTVRVVERFPDYERMPYRLTMAVAPTKNIERFEWFLEKATEVGVSEIVPLLCERSERRALKIERAERVVVSAMKQSLKAFCPALRPLTPLADLLAEPFDGRRLIAHCDAPRMEKRHLFDTLRPHENLLVLIGPEGDFSPAEIDAALRAGFEEITLGRQRLRGAQPRPGGGPGSRQACAGPPSLPAPAPARGSSRSWRGSSGFARSRPGSAGVRGGGRALCLLAGEGILASFICLRNKAR